MSDDVSDAVRAQYEEHPYPFWNVLGEGEVTDVQRDVLFAGCGTGRDILSEARCAPKSSFLGIDLSANSLAHAQQRAADFGITNVRFQRLNILDVATLNETFDYIKSTGVLHHMADPLAGLVALKSVLRPTGHIKFSVYSRRARQAPLAAIELRKQMNIPATNEGIRRFREVILALPPTHPASKVASSPDFRSSVASARDLMFHVCEHNFDIPMLVEMIALAGLQIVQWGPSKAVSKFQAMGYSDLLDWKQWHEAEQKRPDLFSSSMYSVTVKPAS